MTSWCVVTAEILCVGFWYVTLVNYKHSIELLEISVSVLGNKYQISNVVLVQPYYMYLVKNLFLVVKVWVL